MKFTYRHSLKAINAALEPRYKVQKIQDGLYFAYKAQYDPIITNSYTSLGPMYTIGEVAEWANKMLEKRQEIV